MKLSIDTVFDESAAWTNRTPAARTEPTTAPSKAAVANVVAIRTSDLCTRKALQAATLFCLESMGPSRDLAVAVERANLCLQCPATEACPPEVSRGVF